MFFSDEVYEIGKKIDIGNENDVLIELVRLIQKRAQEKLKELKESNKVEHMAVALRRINLMWNIGRENIIKENEYGRILKKDAVISYFRKQFPDICKKVWGEKSKGE